MTRATTHLTLLTAFLAIYLPLLNSSSLPIPLVIQKEILPVLPLWVVVTLGAYMLGSIGWHLMVFNDAPAAQKALEREIEVARGELRGKGVAVD